MDNLLNDDPSDSAHHFQILFTLR